MKLIMHNMKQENYDNSADNAEYRTVHPTASSADGAKRQLRILLLADIAGAGPDYHVGDEAMAEVTINRLKAIVGADNLIMACAHPEAIPSTYGIAAFPFYSWTDRARKRLWRKRVLSLCKNFSLMIYQLCRCDVVFVCGGGNLTSVWPGVLESRLFLFSWALRLRKPLYLVSQTLGPFSPEHRARCQRTLAKAVWLGVRDKSFSARQLKVPVHFSVDDAVFLKARHSSVTQEVMRSHLPAIGLSLRKFSRVSDEQLTELCKAVSQLASKRKLSTLFIPHHSPQGSGDSEIARQVCSIWSGVAPFIALSPIPQASALKALTSECEWVLTMRYHQLIFALSTGVPAIGVYVDEYTHAKLNGAFEQFGLEARIIPIENVSERLEKLVAQVISERVLFRTAARRIAEEALPGNLRAFELLKNLRRQTPTKEALFL
jgi:polysaccharide pyruvyl transferase WcaK-like protein